MVLCSYPARSSILSDVETRRRRTPTFKWGCQTTAKPTSSIGCNRQSSTPKRARLACFFPRFTLGSNTRARTRELTTELDWTNPVGWDTQATGMTECLHRWPSARLVLAARAKNCQHHQIGVGEQQLIGLRARRFCGTGEKAQMAATGQTLQVLQADSG